MTLPNFIIIGPAKCGTTSLCHYLGQHPEIYISPAKEPRFFAPEFYATPPNSLVRKGARRKQMGLQEYKSLFRGVTTEKAIGEASTEYMFFPKSPNRIKELIPQAKLITVLRNPCDRAFSAYCYQRRDGAENLTFKEALEEEEKRSKEDWRPGWRYKEAGFYYEQISRYSELFSPQQLKIFLYEELNQNPLDTLKNIFKFLEVDSGFVPDLSRKNVSSVPQNLLINKMLVPSSPISFLKPYLPDQWKIILRNIREKNRKSKPDLPDDLRETLVKTYEEDILRLQEYIQKDLSSWLMH
ncbi:hypothetical protein C1752_02324 [Acaryochloris thomasi RCC1774]|uniref:Sulfotransferase n=1 Tax=Acaryochloris thomasi RCC1774 TaxID=1764569 RepID=A0A2W1JX60_9CYAN|nr:sulfotransferase [Acaryochloris thomasi]PZD73251.1 hypothetical protein C1752_02324 [Acaryochloris thomasi RCC1774]